VDDIAINIVIVLVSGTLALSN